jgi:hypothetical protein
MQEATDAMFRRVNVYLQFIEQQVERGDEDFTTEALESAAQRWFGSRERNCDLGRLRAELEKQKFEAVARTRKERVRGWRGGRLRLTA